jgi:hypothetical protein
MSTISLIVMSSDKLIVISSDKLRKTCRNGLIAMLVLITVACGDHSTLTAAVQSPSKADSQFPNWPSELNDFRFHWSAEPGIGLTTGVAIAVRAYLESYETMFLTKGITTNTYPGFERATPENGSFSFRANTPYQLTGVRPLSRAEAEAAGSKYVRSNIFGYQPLHILSVEPTGSDYRATVCQGWYATYRTGGGGGKRFVPYIADPDTGKLQYGDWELVTVWRIELTDQDPATASAGSSPLSPQQGPLPAPTGDVFGRWRITGASTGLWGVPGQGIDIQSPFRQQCENAMPDDAATRRAMGTGLHDQPPPHGDPIPGWPAESR